MNNKESLIKIKKDLEEVIKVTPYDLLNFGNREDEESYIDSKTEKFDIYNSLLETDDCDGIIVITDDKTYAVSPIFIHDDAFVKLFDFIYKGQNTKCKPDVIDYYNRLGNVLIRVTNHSDVKGFDSYIPEKLSEFQKRSLERIVKELGFVYRELEKEAEYDDYADSNSKNIKYGIRTIRESLQDCTIKKVL